MKKNTLPWTALLTLVLALGSFLPAGAGEAAAPAPPGADAQPTVAGEPAVCPAEAQAEAVADQARKPEPLDLFLPEAITAGPCPRIGCGSAGLCKQDSDCTAFPGGTCTKFCPSMGCCTY